MPRHKAPPRSTTLDAHAAHAALIARLEAFQLTIAPYGKSRPDAPVPPPTADMAADLIAQMVRQMRHAPEARGLPRLDRDRPVTISELTVAFAQTHQAFDAFGKHHKFDRPVADAASQQRTIEYRKKMMRMINVRIIDGIRSGYLLPSGGPEDKEKRALAKQFTEIVKRLEILADDKVFPYVGETTYR
ncbi:hypothetical protein [Pelagibacterium limicola]|uniref:hypothetical protein n=1 Tax=Pelagibacterium limicola TaxID=2791022 RepID=UPI0018B00D38|nr:hypothetical protein [Pelagibacterium limicola]